ncbi:MAG: hemolysin family protein [Cyclobacteriaceae bacterium]|jgi:CBS domain containing-hemolysin-like protein|nr:hemolysin [Cytophagales bacterium]HNP76563.1 hemolysin family protein [Cyclobacteriaceae bacterium]
MEDLYPWIIASLIFSFFFSGIEIAFLSANRLQIELQSKQGNLTGRIMGYFMQNPSRFIGTTLIGNTLALVIFGNNMALYFTPILTEHLPSSLNNEPSILLTQTVLSTLLILFTAEFLPKSLFMINPNLVLTTLTLPFVVMYGILYPITFSIVNLSKLVIVYILRLEYSEEKPVFGLTDLNHYLRNMHKVSHEDEEIALDKKILHNALEFKTVRVRECMVPRTEITAVALEDGMDKLKSTFVESGHSKIVIYRETIDDVIGYCHSAALFRNPTTIEEILTPISIVTETTMANDLMVQLIRERRSLAVVVDEFGGTAGLVSMEDVIEEIFGDIEDEHDADTLAEQKIDESNYLLSARLEVDYLNEKYNWALPTGDYETLGGLILSYTEDFPQKGETITVPPFTFSIQTMRGNGIDTVRVTVKDGGVED